MRGNCVFCAIIDGTGPAEIVLEEPNVIAFLDNRPVFHGHTLVVPRAHHITFPELPTPLMADVMHAAQRVAAALPLALGAGGTFVAMNNIISQSVPHLHVHVVPRSRRDGLRGFFWPRQPYTDAAQKAHYGQLIRQALLEQDDHAQ